MTSAAERKRRRKRNLAAFREAQEASGGILPDPGRTDGRGSRTHDEPRRTVAEARCRFMGWVEPWQTPNRDQLREAVSPDYAHPHWIATTNGGLTRAMAEAGDIYAKQRGAYDALYLGQRLTALSGVYRYVTDTLEEREAKRKESEARQGAYGRGYSAAVMFDDTEAANRARAAHDPAHAALCGAGMLAEREVIRICVCLDREVPPKLVPLRAGLAALLVHYRSTGEISMNGG